MSYINLLPQSTKRLLRWLLLSRIFFTLSIFVFLWLGITALLLGVAWYYLSIQNDAVKDALAQVRQKEDVQAVEKMESDIKTLNRAIATIQAIEKEEQHNLIVVLEHIAPLIPAGSSLSSIAASADTGIITLKGEAARRSQVVLIEERLKEDPLFAEVKSPISNITASEDITFTFTLTLAQ